MATKSPTMYVPYSHQIYRLGVTYFMTEEFLLQEKNEDLSSLFSECLNIELLFLFPKIHNSHSFCDILNNLTAVVKYILLLNVLKSQ